MDVSNILALVEIFLTCVQIGYDICKDIYTQKQPPKPEKLSD